MKPEVKEAWLAALRSGEFKQGQSALHSKWNGGDVHCCLGVLCDVAVKEGVIPPPVLREGGLDYEYGTPGSLTDSAFLPEEVRDWAELDGCNPVAGESTLAGANDSGEYNFNAIADLIEEHL